MIVLVPNGEGLQHIVVWDGGQHDHVALHRFLFSPHHGHGSVARRIRHGWKASGPVPPDKCYVNVHHYIQGIQSRLLFIGLKLWRAVEDSIVTAHAIRRCDGLSELIRRRGESLMVTVRDKSCCKLSNGSADTCIGIFFMEIDSLLVSSPSARYICFPSYQESIC